MTAIKLAAHGDSGVKADVYIPVGEELVQFYVHHRVSTGNRFIFVADESRREFDLAATGEVFASALLKKAQERGGEGGIDYTAVVEFVEQYGIHVLRKIVTYQLDTSGSILKRASVDDQGRLRLDDLIVGELVGRLFEGHVGLDGECLDRVYLNGYVPNLSLGAGHGCVEEAA